MRRLSALLAVLALPPAAAARPLADVALPPQPASPVGVVAVPGEPGRFLGAAAACEAEACDEPLRRSTDGGRTWSAVAGPLGALAAAPSGGAVWSLQPGRLGPLSVSADGGRTWRAAPGTAPVDRVWPRDALVALGLRERALRAPDGDEALCLHRSLPAFGAGLRRTADGGRTWTHVLDAPPASLITVVAPHPTDPLRLALATARIAAPRTAAETCAPRVLAGAVRVSSDGGRTFATTLRTTSAVGALAWTPGGLVVASGRTLRRSAAGDGRWQALAPTRGGIEELVALGDGGLLALGARGAEGRGTDGRALPLPPGLMARTRHVAIAGDAGVATGPDGTRRTLDGGATFLADVVDETASAATGAVGTLDGRTAVVAAGGRALARVAGAWRPLAELPGAATPLALASAPAPGGRRVAWAATDVGVLVSRDGGGSWRRVAGAGALRIDPRDGRTALRLDGGRVFRTDDAGARWRRLLDREGLVIDAAVRGRAVAVLLLDLEADGTAREAVASLRSDDAGRTWRRLPPAPCGDPEAVALGRRGDSLATLRSCLGRLVVGHVGRRDVVLAERRAALLASADGGRTWRRLGAAGIASAVIADDGRSHVLRSPAALGRPLRLVTYAAP